MKRRKGKVLIKEERKKEQKKKQVIERTGKK